MRRGRIVRIRLLPFCFIVACSTPGGPQTDLAALPREDLVETGETLAGPQTDLAALPREGLVETGETPAGSNVGTSSSSTTSTLAPLELIEMPSQAALTACEIPTPIAQGTEGDESTHPNTGFPFVLDNLPSSGDVRVVVVPVDWVSYQGDDSALQHEFEQVELFEEFYEDVSNGLIQVEAQFVDEWTRIPGTPDDYGQEYESDYNFPLAQAAVDAVDGSIDFADIDILIVVLPEVSPIPAGKARFYEGSAPNHASFQGFEGQTRGITIKSDEGVIPNWMGAGAYFDDIEDVRNEWSYYVHETGHMFELPDYYLRGDLDRLYSPRSDLAPVEIPGGPFGTWSVMASQDGPSRTMNAWSRWLIGWLDDEVICFDARNVEGPIEFDVEIWPIDSAGVGPKAVIVRTGENAGFALESRRPNKWDSGLQAYEDRLGIGSSGVLVYSVQTKFGTQEGALRLKTPEGRYFVDMRWSDRNPPRQLDALFGEGDSTLVDGSRVTIRRIGDVRDVVRMVLGAPEQEG